MQAIVTKCISPSDTKGSRIKATCDAGSITIPYPHALSGDAVHAKAAMALVHKMGWHADSRSWACGGLPNQAGYVFVWVGPYNQYSPADSL
jgi:hypothetical protein